MKNSWLGILICSFFIAGCGQSADNGKLRIGMMPKLVGISYFDATQQGAEELDVTLVYDGPTQASSTEQSQMINGWVSQGFDVIAVAPNDPDGISKTLANAKSSGVTVLTWDTDANAEKSNRTVFVNQAPNEALAKSLVDAMARGAGEDGKLKGKYLIVSGTPTASNQNTWIELMKTHLEADHPDCELVPILYPGEDQRKAQVQTAEALSAHDDLRGIWGLTSVALPAAARAVRDIERANEIYVTGLSLPSLMREYVKDDTVKEFVLWDAVALGYLSVHVAKRLHEDGLKPGRYDMGRLKNIEVTKDEVILGPPLIFNNDNIDEFKF